MNTTSRLSNEVRFRSLSADVTRPRERTQETAQRLSLIAIRNWEKSLTGIVAFPAAVALSTSAAVLFGVSIIESAFGLIEQTLSDVGRRVGEDFDAHGDHRDSSQAS
jgi:hypothetical protein